ncbi:MAG: DmsE family decaheme c-type cytochrome [Acidobacteriota bacterium]
MTVRSKWSFSVNALLISALLLLGTRLAFGRASPQNAVAGSETATQCASCHQEVVSHFYTTRHGKADKFQAWGSFSGCASCHGDTQQHAESGDPSLVSKPDSSSNGWCLSCHNNQHSQNFWGGSAHDTGKVSCLSCHSIHKAKSAEKLLAKATVNEGCLSCHVEVKKSQTQRSTHLFRDEWRNQLMKCTDCHSPHGSQTAKMIKAGSVNESCLACHMEKRGPFLWQHSPVQENCLTCHAAHGSNNASLLVARTTQLCQSCHMQGRHQTVAGKPNSAWVFNRSCLNCHAQIHGSNHPSGPVLMR